MYHRNVKSECILYKIFNALFWSIMWNMHKISFENIVWQQSYQSLNIKNKYFAVYFLPGHSVWFWHFWHFVVAGANHI